MWNTFLHLISIALYCMLRYSVYVLFQPVAKLNSLTRRYGQQNSAQPPFGHSLVAFNVIAMGDSLRVC